MAKVKKGKKGKKKGGKRKKVEEDKDALTEVDKTFYELQITDLNRKLARLRSLTADLEQKNEVLTQELQKLEEDRSDIIVYLKRMLQEKSDEIKEVQDRLTALQETRMNETEEYENKIKELEEEYKQLHEQLTSEIKLLEGKLNALEEFRVQRDELMKKYELQEIQIDEQEKRHKRELYEAEKKFIISKDKLKKEMEARLLQLSTEFHDATELRIASTTHRVIRENIAINNELEIMLGTHKRLYSENVTMKERDRTLRQKAELFESEARRALQRSKVQTTLIERLAEKNKFLDREMENYNVLQKHFINLKKELDEVQRREKIALHKLLIVEQNLHQSRTERASLMMELSKLKDENDHYMDVIYEAVNAIQECMFIGSASSEESLQTVSRTSLLNNLYNLLTIAEDFKSRKDSVETVESAKSIYMKGDLGFVPKPIVPRSKIPVKRHVECQTGPSLEHLTSESSESEAGPEIQPSATVATEKTEELGEETVIAEEEKMSIVFFGEEESVEEESTVSYGSQDLRDYIEAQQKASKFLSDIFVPDNTVSSTINTLKSSRSRIAYENDLEIQRKQSSHAYVEEKLQQLHEAEEDEDAEREEVRETETRVTYADKEGNDEKGAGTDTGGYAETETETGTDTDIGKDTGGDTEGDAQKGPEGTETE